MSIRVIAGDVRTVLQEHEARSFDACFCDPPYGLGESRPANSATPRKSSRDAARAGFMGMKWDATVPDASTWREVHRVLKPGAPLLVFGGTRTFHRLACAIEDAGFILTDTLCWLHGQGFPKGRAQLKPAWEPITLAWKKGARLLNIDASRIETGHHLHGSTVPNDIRGGRFGRGRPNPGDLTQYVQSPLGRWPANVILSEEAAASLDEQSGILTSGNNPAKRHAPKTRDIYGLGFGDQCLVHRGTDSGGASRFFYCAKASRKERGESNTHPTVKPLKLTEYLARLILPPRQGRAKRKLLVPFAGSGSEMIGARNAGWDEIVGIELNPAYVSMCLARASANTTGPLS